MKTSLAVTFPAALIAAMLSACTPDKPTGETLRPVRTIELRYDKAQETHRHFGSVQARHEVDLAFRVGGKVVERRVDVGDTVREGNVLAVLDDTDYRLAEEAARQQLIAATARNRAGRWESESAPGMCQHGTCCGRGGQPKMDRPE